jgi:hypothetical protein
LTKTTATTSIIAAVTKSAPVINSLTFDEFRKKVSNVIVDIDEAQFEDTVKAAEVSTKVVNMALTALGASNQLFVIGSDLPVIGAIAGRLCLVVC